MCHSGNTSCKFVLNAADEGRSCVFVAQMFRTGHEKKYLKTPIKYNFKMSLGWLSCR